MLSEVQDTLAGAEKPTRRPPRRPTSGSSPPRATAVTRRVPLPGRVGEACSRSVRWKQPRGFGDGFGAPRYVGGYHLHKGVDIVAPMGTPIYATFDGVASDATNIYGGTAVYVQGKYGSTYNAHMTSIAKLGPVQAGDVIGYVGSTGLAGGETNHNHFEFRPNVMPSSWPASYYGLLDHRRRDQPVPAARRRLRLTRACPRPVAELPTALRPRISRPDARSRSTTPAATSNATRPTGSAAGRAPGRAAAGSATGDRHAGHHT